jgi:hypothetical protein
MKTYKAYGLDDLQAERMSENASLPVACEWSTQRPMSAGRTRGKDPPGRFCRAHGGSQVVSCVRTKCTALELASRPNDTKREPPSGENNTGEWEVHKEEIFLEDRLWRSWWLASGAVK